MRAVSDTTAVTTLLKVGRVDLLVGLFGSVLIPGSVHRELWRYHGTVPACCELREVADSPRLRRLLAQADAGEAEAICLALDTSADVLLIDDKKGRRLAEAAGLRCLGLPALLLAAKEQGRIASVAEFLDVLEQRGNFCLARRFRGELLQRAKE